MRNEQKSSEGCAQMGDDAAPPPGRRQDPRMLPGIAAKGLPHRHGESGGIRHPVDQLDISSRVALVFGNELHGLSHAARECCDEQVKIPMYGFTESLNISVSAALCIFALTDKIRKSGVRFRLTEEECDELRLAWYRKIIKRSEIIEREYLRTIA